MSDTKSVGRPAFVPTPEMREQVEKYISVGMKLSEISLAVGCSEPTLRMYFAENIALGRAHKRAWLIERMFETAEKNGASQRHLYEVMEFASADATVTVMDKAVRADKIGKKEQAAVNATTAGVGTEWGDDLKSRVSPSIN